MALNTTKGYEDHVFDCFQISYVPDFLIVTKVLSPKTKE